MEPAGIEPVTSCLQRASEPAQERRSSPLKHTPWSQIAARILGVGVLGVLSGLALPPVWRLLSRTLGSRPRDPPVENAGCVLRLGGERFETAVTTRDPRAAP